MANIEISTFTRNNDGNTYVIKDANAIPKSGSSAISGDLIPSTDNTVSLGSINNHINNIYCTEVRGSDSNCCTVCGGSAWLKGAGISLRGKDYSGESGEFALVAVNDTNMSDLRGKPNGILMWNGKNIDCIEEQGDGYIRYSNGLQICWGTITWQSACTMEWGSLYETSDGVGSYAKSFIEIPFFSAYSDIGGSSAMLDSNTGTKTSTPQIWLCRGKPVTVEVTCTARYIAIGRWK